MQMRAWVYRIAAALVSSTAPDGVGRADREWGGVYIGLLLAVPGCSEETKWELLYLKAVQLLNLARNR